MSLAGVAQETVRIVEQGEYVAPSGRTNSLREPVERAVRGTVLPVEAAGAFAAALSALPGAFERVVFAVYERGGEGPNLRAFRERFGQRPS